MPTGLLDEVRRIAESGKDIPQEVVNRLMLTALAELVEKVEKHTGVEETRTDSLETSIAEIDTKVSNLGVSVSTLAGKVTELANEVVAVRSNPVVMVGGFFKRHPVPSFTISIILTAAIIVLLTSKPFLVLLLTLTGVPNEAIEQFMVLLFQ